MYILIDSDDNRSIYVLQSKAEAERLAVYLNEQYAKADGYDPSEWEFEYEIKPAATLPFNFLNPLA